MKYICNNCGKEFKRTGTKPALNCSRKCKYNSERNKKKWTKEWLYQKYIIEELGVYEIAKMVNRNPKQVYWWLKGFNIPTRSKKESIILFNKRKSTREKRSKSSKGKSVSKKTREKISKARTGKFYPKLQGKNNGMYGRRGELSPNWKGGHTPERASFYSSIRWKNAIKKVWKRDKGYCQRCNIKSKYKSKFHIHHIVSFSIKSLRSKLSNLLLVCEKCHLWIHSRANSNKQFIKEYEHKK